VANYDFNSLTDYDFEILVRDLLQEEWNITLESFKPGRDMGIDLRYSLVPGWNMVIQCKHFAKSGYSALYNHLKKSEVPKVKVLKPEWYVVATSVGLTPKNKDDIRELFAPYCQTTGHVLGKEDLNNLLGKYPDIEKRNFKLWLASTAVLERIIHSSTLQRSTVEVERLRQKIRYYVYHVSVIDAMEMLEENHYCIISGVPGIGKTTLAEILLVHYIDQGYEIITVSGDIDEAFALLSPEKKQVFYYDDFLGQTSLDFKFAKNEDKRLLDFIAAISRMENVRFILTTREYLLNQAKMRHERLSLSRFDVSKRIIDLSDYTRFERANILSNHLHFSDIPQEYKENILSNNAYFEIVDHPNYSPRIIEWMTNYLNVKHIKPNDYSNWFLLNLDNPAQLWEHAFSQQIAEASRYLLLTLFSLPREVVLSDAEEAFKAFCDCQVRLHNFFASPFDLKTAIRELEGNFIVTDKVDDEILIRFHNPSIRDFIQEYLVRSPKVFQELLSASIYFDQCIELSNHNNTYVSVQMIAKTFWEAISRTLRSPTCRLTRYIDEYGILRIATQSMTLESRILFLGTMMVRLPHKISDEVFASALSLLIRRLRRNRCDKNNLIKVVDVVYRYKFDSSGMYEELLHESSRLLAHELYSAGDFEAFVQFHQSLPELVSEVQFLDAKEKFHVLFSRETFNVLQEGIKKDARLNWFEDGEEDTSFEAIYQMINSFGTLADYFDIDVGAEIGVLEHYVGGVDLYAIDAKDYDDLWEEDEVYSSLEDEEIMHLFDTLSSRS
jgi:hypothetical protein